CTAGAALVVQMYTRVQCCFPDGPAIPREGTFAFSCQGVVSSARTNGAQLFMAHQMRFVYGACVVVQASCDRQVSHRCSRYPLIQLIDNFGQLLQTFFKQLMFDPESTNLFYKRRVVASNLG